MGRVNQFREEMTPNALAVEVMMHIDGVFQGAGEGISGPERTECAPANHTPVELRNQNRHGCAMLLIPRFALTFRTGSRAPNACRMNDVIVEDLVDAAEVGRNGRTD